MFYRKPKEKPITMTKVETRIINSHYQSIKLRLYYPLSNNLQLPTLMYFHGGGFVIRDDMDIYDQTCRRIAREVGCVVIAVDYRLAPEHPFPAALEDCFFATSWVFNNSKELNINSSKIGVWGESCGGNLAAVVAVMARDTMRWFWKQYFSGVSDIKSPYALPIRGTNFNDLAPALVFTTELDVLKDDGRLYANLLSKSNTDVRYKCYEGLVHGFFDLYTRVNEAKIACDDIMFRVRSLFLIKN